MSTYLSENPIKEKLKLLIKLIDCYEKNALNSDEIHYIIDIIFGFDISKDKNFENIILLDELKTMINIDFAYYTSNENDIVSTPELFGPSVLKENLKILKNKINIYLNKNEL